MNNDLDTQPWYRQFWPWMLIALPAAAVIACVVTIVIAVKNPDIIVKQPQHEKVGRMLTEKPESQP